MNKRLIISFLGFILVITFWLAFNNIFNIELANSKSNGNQRGNTLGNIEGYAGQIGDWIYYAALMRLNEPYNEIFCRENLKNGRKEKLSNDSVRNVNLLEGWVYYNTNEPDGVGPIYRMKLDGSNKKKLNNDQSGFVNVVEDYIYYVNYSDGSKIYRMKLDGSEQKKMNDDQSWSLNVTDGWIYFASGNNIYKMPANGGAKKRILSENVGLMTIHQKWIYYFNGTKGKLYKATVDGTNKMQITDDIINKFNIAGGYIYYSVNKDDMTSYIGLTP